MRERERGKVKNPPFLQHKQTNNILGRRVVPDVQTTRADWEEGLPPPLLDKAGHKLSHGIQQSGACRRPVSPLPMEMEAALFKRPRTGQSHERSEGAKHDNPVE